MVFSCKMCGANLDVQQGMRICKCNYCDSVQTIPDLSSEHKAELFNRANKLRFGCDFDRAANIYRDIVADFPEEAEAYWGLCLCKYGVEYVTDPSTNQRIPTCHRTSFEKILDIPDFRKVLEYSESSIRNVYIGLAESIDSIQQRILAIALNEKPFDVFICYKESDSDGNRTPDAVIADSLYKTLTEQNIKVFYAPVTLKNKLGTEFEPYIYSAVNSAQVMICVGTSADYFDSVWVRNEWSRFIELMKKDKSKVLIPCYESMSVSELPYEFRGFQAQDMSETGAKENILKSTKAVMSAGENAKSQLNVLMEQFEGQLKNERDKLHRLESLHHRQMTEEKKNAKKFYSKERISPLGLVVLDFTILLITILFGVYLIGEFNTSSVGLFIIMVLECGLFSLEIPYARKRNNKARENLERRMAYNENAPDFDYNIEDSDIIEKRKQAYRSYDKKYISVRKYLIIAWLGGYLIPRIISIPLIMLGADCNVIFTLMTILKIALPLVALPFVIIHNRKVKRQLKEQLEFIDKK